MKRLYRISIILSVIFGLSSISLTSIGAFGLSTTFPESYSSSIKLSESYYYTVNQFGKNSTWFSQMKDYHSNPGGQIVVTPYGFGDKPINPWFTPQNPDPVPYLGVCVKYLDAGQLKINMTITNTANTDAASELVLGYNDYLPGFFASINWTHEKSMAENAVASTGFLPGTVTFDDSSPTEVRIHLVQNTGDQNTYLVYNKTNGVLLYAKTQVSFGNPILEITLQGYGSQIIPGYPLDMTLIICAVSIISLVVILKKVKLHLK